MRNENSNKSEKTASHKGHMWMMAVCCGLPIIGFIAIAVLGVSMPSLETALPRVRHRDSIPRSLDWEASVLTIRLALSIKE